MSQTTYIQMVNEEGAPFRSHLNEMLEALNTEFAGATAPTVTTPYMVWLDTSVSPPVRKRRDAANTLWEEIASSSGSESYEYNVRNDPYLADATGASDTASAIQDALDDANTSGGTVKIPRGVYSVSTTADQALLLSQTNLDGVVYSTPYAVNVVGEGQGNTIIKPASTGKYAIKVQGVNSGGFLPHVHSTLEKFAIGGTQRGNGLWLYDTAFIAAKDLVLQNNDIALKLESCLSSTFENLHIAGNYKGVYADIGTGFSGPNAIQFNNCRFNSNRDYGYAQTRGTNNSFIGCVIEGNGTQGDAATGGININVSGLDGDVGTLFDGCYFEGNAGGWDVNITNTGSRYVTHTFRNCNFNRISSTSYVTNNVKSIGKNILVFEGCTFLGYGTYSESAARIYINADSSTVVILKGCSFGSSTASHNLDLTYGNQIIGSAVGYTATNCTTSFVAEDSSKVNYFEVDTTVGGWLTLGKPYVANTPGIGFRCSSSTAPGAWDVQFYGETGTGSTGQGTAVLSAALFKTKAVQPIVDNGYTLGAASYRWSVVYAGTGAINTSDERLKTFYETTDVEKTVALELKALLKKYKFNDAIEAKGEDTARFHFGIGAQSVKAVFEKYDLDPTKYALFCYDEWDRHEVTEVLDGEIVTKLVEAGNRYGIRYDELLCFIVANM